MAQKVITTLLDDVDGSEANTTVSFGYQGKQYEIDLSELNAKALDESLQEFIPHARVVSGRKTATRPTSRPDRETNDAIRAWATENGFQIAQRGRIPGTITEAYHAAQG